MLVVKSDDLTELHISPRNWNDGLRLGIIKCHPKSVGEIEQLADAAPDLLRTIAKELRELGMDDLRGRWDKLKDDSDAQFEAMLAKVQADAERAAQ